MTSSPLLHCLYFCRRAVSVAILFSSLVCSTWAGEPGVATGQSQEVISAQATSVFSDAILRERAARAGGIYAVTGNANRTVPPGTYSGIKVDSPAASANSPDIIIGAGEVVLTGDDGPMFTIQPSSSNKNNKIQIQTTTQPAILRLEKGEATGIIGVGPVSTRDSVMRTNRDALLYIGDGSAEPAQTTIIVTGAINGIGGTAITKYKAESLLETQGANLIVHGTISNSQSQRMLRTLNAFNGNIETQATPGIINGNADIFAYNANVKAGNHIKAGEDFFASSVNIAGNAYISAAKRIDILDTIGEGGGSMAPGSILEADKLMVLRSGLTKGAGTIISGTGSILAHDTTGDKDRELALFPIKQGGDDPLVLEAGQDILPGETDVDTMRAGGDLVAGTQTFTSDNFALPGRYFLNAGGDGFTYPRSKITANTIDVKGRLLAGELQMPRGSDGKEASLKAGNMLIARVPAENGFEASSGNFTLDNGSFTLTNPQNLQVNLGLEDKTNKKVTLDYPSIVDGNVTVTRNKASSFTGLQVGEAISVSEGTLAGDLLNANALAFSKNDASIAHTQVIENAKITDGSYSGVDFRADTATFANVGSIRLDGALGEGVKANLDIAKDLTITGKSDVTATSTSVGGTAMISGGTYSGADFSADSATFTDVSRISFTDSLTLETGLTMTDSVANGIASLMVNNGDATIGGGSYSGGSLKAKNAEFTGVAGVTLTDSLALSGNLKLESTGQSSIARASIEGYATLSGGSYSGTTFSAGEADFSGLEAVNLGGDFTASTNATFNNVNALSISGQTKTGGDFTQTGGSSTLANMSVGDTIAITSGYLKAKDATALGASFENSASAEFDDLKLTGDDLTLVIEEGSTVFINNSLSDLKGIEAIQGGKLIIRGHNDAPSTRPELYIDKDTELVQERGIFDLTKGLYGGDKDGKTSTASFSQLTAGEIEITNVDLTLAGIGSFANKVDRNLIIYQNGNSRLGDISVGGFAEIDGGSLSAGQMDVKENATFDGVNLNLAGPGTIGGDLVITSNADSSIGDMTVAGNAKISGGALAAGKLETGSATLAGAIQANIQSLVVTASSGSLDVGAEGEERSTVTAYNVELNGAALTVYGDSALQINSVGENSGNLNAGPVNIPETGTISAYGDITADSVSLGQAGAALAGANVTVNQPLTAMKGGEITATDGNVTLAGGAKDAAGAITANAAIIAGSKENYADIDGEELALEAGTNISAGIIKANSLKAGANIAAQDIAAKALTAGGNVTASAGSVNLDGPDNRIGGNLVALDNVKSSLGTLEVGGETRFANGELKAELLSTGSASLANIKVAFDDLVLNDPAGSGQFALAGTGSQGSEATVGSLNLNGGLLNLAANNAGPANMFIGKFSGQNNVINGNIAVNQNGLLVLGAQNANLLQTPDAIASSGLATFALAQPMRLDSRFGIHVTGAGGANPVANAIRFDAGSLFVIDSRMTKAVYAYLGSLDNIVPSARLSETNGAIGALSADRASATANVNMGAQIFIRNPQPNTVIVALGENIATSYADRTARAGDAGSAPWTGANLDYDNKDTVKIQRLEDQYAGQFLVLPIDAPDPGGEEPKPPVEPDPPVNPDPDRPNPPVEPGPDKPNPPKPTQPSTPDQPGPSQPGTPSSPDPDTPAEPANPESPEKPEPDEPNEPENPDEPDTPEQPVAPVEPEPQPLRPGQQFIHDAHAAFSHDPGKIEQVINSASHLATAGGVPHLIHAANDTASEVILRRARILDILAEGEELTGRSFALWALPLYKGINGHDLGAGSGEYGYAGGIGGVIIGADVTFAQKFRAGLDFNIGGGYTKSSGELAQTENNMSFWGLGAYAGYREGNLGLEAEFSFTSSYNKVKQETPADLHWGELKSDILATAVSAALRAEYRFETEFLDVVPHAGIRYLNLHALSYDINASGRGTIVEGSGFYQNIWTFPFGIYLGRTFELENGVRIMPSLDFTVVPAAGDLDTKNRVWYTGEVQEFDLHARFMDEITYGGSAGIEVKAWDFTIGVNYAGQFGKHTASNGIFGLLRYEF